VQPWKLILVNTQCDSKTIAAVPSLPSPWLKLVQRSVLAVFYFQWTKTKLWA